MIYTELVTIILGISLFFYALLGGADFGAGVLEIFIGNRGNSTISKAMAPVWEANHIWLIIAVVILFNGFPKVYAVFSTALHIPILALLMGIIFRGAAFTFRHYDAVKDDWQDVYSKIFRYSSLFTIFFLGLILGTMIAGTIPPAPTTFFDYYLSPWLNPFTISFGIFVCILSTYIAAIFLLGEVETAEGYQMIRRFASRLLIASILAGIGLLASAKYMQLAFFNQFTDHWLSMACLLLATIVIPLIFYWINKKAIAKLRWLVGFQIALIMAGWLIIQWPDLIAYSNGESLSIYNSSSPEITMQVLFWALMVGILIIFPALYYLFRVFKS